jgi:phosphatidylserine decarboxylase
MFGFCCAGESIDSRDATEQEIASFEQYRRHVFAREGFFIIGVVSVLALALVLLALRFGPITQFVLIAIAVVAITFTLYFFRDPLRTPPDDDEHRRLILSPADGKVVLVQDAEDSLYLKGPVKQVSIFLSPLNVHVNRAPVDGTVEYDEYVAGEYLVAWHPKASEKNERSQIGVRHPSGEKVLFKQIAGAVARRIVYHIKVGDQVKAGERFGIVKFGSRMDVLVSPQSEIFVKVGDRVTAGETVLGRLPSASVEEPAVTQADVQARS